MAALQGMPGIAAGVRALAAARVATGRRLGHGSRVRAAVGGMMRAVLLVASALAIPTVAPAQSCEQIRFAPGAYSGEVRGSAPADGCACYVMDVGDGQRARVRIFSAADAAVTVRGVQDNRTDVSWVTSAGRYELCVHRTFRAAEGLPFRMVVEVR